MERKDLYREERELIRRAKEGEKEACERLIEQNRGAIYRHILGIVKDQEIAEDITQESLIHAFQHLGSFRMRARFSTWLWRIAHNQALNHLKKKGPHLEPFLEQRDQPQESAPHEENFEFLEKIERAMQLLSPKQRLVFELYDRKRIPQKQIAVQLGIPLGTVRSRLYYARKNIKELLNP